MRTSHYTPCSRGAGLATCSAGTPPLAGRFLAQDFDLVVSNAFISHPSRLGGPWSPDTSSSRTSITDLNFDEKVDTYLPHRKGFLQSGPMPSISAGFLSLCLIWGLSWVAIKYSREATLKKEATWKS